MEPTFRGHGLGEHASAVDYILSKYLLQPESSYSFGLEGHVPEGFSELQNLDKSQREHLALCSMFKYFQQLQVVRPFTPDDYIDWISSRLAAALNVETEQVKASILGLPPPHPFEDDVLQGITDQGCAANQYVYSPIADTGGLLSAAPDGTHPSSGSGHDIEADDPDSGGLHVRDFTTDNDLVFSVMNGDTVFNDYVTSLTHEMHLIVIRDDLQHFYHIHPSRDQYGTWHMKFSPSTGGTYWVYANFSDAEGHSYALRFSHVYPGGEGEPGLTLSYGFEKTLGSYHFALQPIDTQNGMSFTYKITDDTGARARIQEFMGAFGHQVIISTNGYFSHSHPASRVDHDPIFFIETPPHGTYTVIVVFEIDGQEYLIPYQWTR